MFTGIITDIGSIRSIKRTGDVRLEVFVKFDTKVIHLGSSICCSGVCLTVVDKGLDWFAVEVSNETLSRTTIGSWINGTKINLEKALLVGEEIGGHIVSGHVDDIGRLSKIISDEASVRMSFSVSPKIIRLIAEKGSITIDGISLTVNSVFGNEFDVSIIEYTQSETTLLNLAPGGAVNIEVDILARYVARFLDRE